MKFSERMKVHESYRLYVSKVLTDLWELGIIGIAYKTHSLPGDQ